MASPRIRGESVEVRLIVDGKLQDTITDVRSFEFEHQIDTQQEGYLGETTDRFDEAYRGVRGRLALHVENDDVLDLFTKVVDRSRRREPGTRINVAATLSFPNGDRPRMIFEDVFFGGLPLGFGGRTEYGEVTLEFRCASAERLA